MKIVNQSLNNNMAKISGLPPSEHSLVGSELLAIVQGGSTVSAAISSIWDGMPPNVEFLDYAPLDEDISASITTTGVLTPKADGVAYQIEDIGSAPAFASENYPSSYPYQLYTHTGSAWLLRHYTGAVSYSSWLSDPISLIDAPNPALASGWTPSLNIIDPAATGTPILTYSPSLPKTNGRFILYNGDLWVNNATSDEGNQNWYLLGGESLFQYLDYAPLNSDKTGLFISGDLLSNDEVVHTNVFVDEDGVGGYYDDASSWEIYKQDGFWTFVYYQTFGVWTGASENDPVDSQNANPTGDAVGILLPSLVTRPKTTGQFAIFDNNLYVNRGGDDTPSWVITPRIDQVVTVADNQTIIGIKTFNSNVNLPNITPSTNQAIRRSYAESVFSGLIPGITAEVLDDSTTYNPTSTRPGAWWVEAVTTPGANLRMRLNSTDWKNWASRKVNSQLGATIAFRVVAVFGTANANARYIEWHCFGRNNSNSDLIAIETQNHQIGTPEVTSATITFDHVANGKLDVIITPTGWGRTALMSISYL